MNDFETHPIGTTLRIKKLESDNQQLGEYIEKLLKEIERLRATIAEL